MPFLDRLLGREQAAGDPTRAQAVALYEAVQAASAPLTDGGFLFSWPPLQPVLEAPADVRMAVLLLACVDAEVAEHSPARLIRASLAQTVAYHVAVTRPASSPAQLAAVLDAIEAATFSDPNGFAYMDRVVAMARKPLAAEVIGALERVRDRLASHDSWWAKQVVLSVDRLLWNTGRTLRAEGPWSRRVLDDIAAMEADRHDAWGTLTQHLISAGDPAPSKKWQAALPALLEAVGRDEARSRILAWLALGPVPGETARGRMREQDAHYLKGFVWALSGSDDAAAPVVLADLAEQCLKKVPQLGPVAARPGNACIRALAGLPGPEAIAQLGRLRERVKYAVGRQLIDKALAEAAARAGLTPEALEEIAVPTFGLDATGTMRRAVGAFTAEVQIAGTHEVSLAWLTAEGSRRKGVPAPVRTEHAPTLAELKKTVKTIASILPGQKGRLERLLTEDRSWAVEDWRVRYLEHPVVGQMARRLIWQFADGDRTGLGGVVDGRVVGVDDQPLSWLGPSATVRCWHPLGTPVEQVQAWRAWLERHQIRQPFKQAHREIYLLTDAERATATYSNRFAGHVLRQHQFAALCRERGWRYQIQGGWDSQNTPTLRLPGSNLQIQFWIDTPDDPDAMGQSGIYDYVSTDQVRFLDALTAVPLDTVPALAFSEAMRDVDLFVGVCSLGTDPAWADRGAGRFNAYWHSFAFGELGAAAATRREMLEGLIPRLRGRERLSLDKTSLVVRGELWTYRIHLGSGNILMEPGSRYLCIVPDRSEGDGDRADVWLPFEGDRMLAIIISKALLLLKDAEITDPVIVGQIRG